MKTLSATEFELDCQASMQSKQVAYDVRGFDEVGNTVNAWFKDDYKLYTIGSEVEVNLDCDTIYRDRSIENNHDDFQVLASKFYLSGTHHVVCPGINNVSAEYSETGGYNYLFYLPEIQEIEQFFAGQPLQKVKIYMDLAFLQNFITGLEEIPHQLQPLIEGDGAPLFHRCVGQITPMMGTVIRQMWDHPYNGAIARMYLEGKVLELLALQLSQLLESERGQAKERKLRLKDIERLHYARSILQQNYLNPPSIKELAQQVELNRIKLQQGFRQVFNTTPFGYLQNYRLDLARVMLQDEDLTVSTVANRVGYSNISYFSRTFKRRFGITPGQCRC